MRAKKEQIKLLKEFGMGAAAMEEGGAASPNRPAPTEESIVLFLILFFNLFS